MEIIYLKKLNVRKRLEMNSKIDVSIPKMSSFDDNFLLKETPKTDLLDRTQFNKDLMPSFKLMPEEIMNPPLNVSEQAEKSTKEINDFEFKNLDVNSYNQSVINRHRQFLK